MFTGINMSNTTSQTISPQESQAIEKYLAQRYFWQVEFTLHLVFDEPALALREPITMKNDDVFLLHGGKLYHQSKHGEATPLPPLEGADGLFLFTDSEEGRTIHLELARVSGFASALAPA
jgi:hypothetical protein